jgi:lambda family phage minor tail protein L
MAQQLSTDALVELFELDTTSMTTIHGVPGVGATYNWTPGTLGGAPVMFGGVAYTPIDIEASGWEWNGQGKLPQPKIRVANIGGIASGLVAEYGDLVGATITRMRVYQSNLDGQPNADASAFFEPDMFTVNRKSNQNKAFIEFELRSRFDAQNLKLPRRQVLRDTCTQTYRAYRDGAFIQGSCPYVGTAYFTVAGASTTDPAADQCGRKQSDCLLRFGNAPLPTYAFPGAGIAMGTP